MYGSLCVADIANFMHSETDSYDILLAGDVFIYVRNLSPLY